MCCSRSTGRARARQRFPGAIGIFILPPSIEELEARLARGQDEPQVIARRLMAAAVKSRTLRNANMLLLIRI